MATYMKPDGSTGSYLENFAKVFRREGRDCVRCGETILKTRVAGGEHIIVRNVRRSQEAISAKGVFWGGSFGVEAAVKEELGEDYEVFDGEDLEVADLPSIFQGTSLFGGDDRRILLKNLGENLAVLGRGWLITRKLNIG